MKQKKTSTHIIIHAKVILLLSYDGNTKLAPKHCAERHDDTSKSLPKTSSKLSTLEVIYRSHNLTHYLSNCINTSLFKLPNILTSNQDFTRAITIHEQSKQSKGNLVVDPGLVSDPVRRVFFHQDVDPGHIPAVQVVLRDTLNQAVLETHLAYHTQHTRTLV